MSGSSYYGFLFNFAGGVLILDRIFVVLARGSLIFEGPNFPGLDLGDQNQESQHTRQSDPQKSQKPKKKHKKTSKAVSPRCWRGNT